jgi:hypothetical protein
MLKAVPNLAEVFFWYAYGQKNVRVLVVLDGPKVSDQIFEGHPPVCKKFIQLDVG